MSVPPKSLAESLQSVLICPRSIVKLLPSNIMFANRQPLQPSTQQSSSAWLSVAPLNKEVVADDLAETTIFGAIDNLKSDIHPNLELIIL